MKREQKIYLTLRIASAMCFIGHGIFGLITKQVWCNYFAVVGIEQDMAYQLMPVVGLADIILGLGLLVYPLKIIPIWLVIWSLITAAMRPLSGEHFAEFLERAGNFGAPLALLILCAKERGFKGWNKPLQAPFILGAEKLKSVILCLKITAALLLGGHGWLNLLHKKGLINQYLSLGFNNADLTANIMGTIEIVAALFILIRPIRPVVLFFLVWKMGTELFYPQWGLVEWVERGGSYGTLLALYFALQPEQSLKN
ncbi:hypothetical protein ACXZ1K_06380 [Pedobacter sp. PWIIR3]